MFCASELSAHHQGSCWHCEGHALLHCCRLAETFQRSSFQILEFDFIDTRGSTITHAHGHENKSTWKADSDVTRHTNLRPCHCLFVYNRESLEMFWLHLFNVLYMCCKLKTIIYAENINKKYVLAHIQIFFYLKQKQTTIPILANKHQTLIHPNVSEFTPMSENQYSFPKYGHQRCNSISEGPMMYLKHVHFTLHIHNIKVPSMYSWWIPSHYQAFK